MSFKENDKKVGKIGAFLAGADDRMKTRLYQAGQSAVDEFAEGMKKTEGWQPPGADRWRAMIGEKSQGRKTEKQIPDEEVPVKAGREKQTGYWGTLFQRITLALFSMAQAESRKQGVRTKPIPKNGNIGQNTDTNKSKSRDTARS